jgi:hypothetical protein
MRQRGTEAAAEALVEVGDLVETAGIRDLAHLEAVVLLPREHGHRLLQAQLHHPLGEARATLVQ